MKKALSNTKVASSSNFVRKVLSRGCSKPPNEKERIKVMENSTRSDTSNLEVEVAALKDQISMLQLAVSAMQDDTETKEKALGNLAREKEQLGCDLRRERRSSTSLKKQLDDEREFYFKEKEHYCQEMNDCKNLKKKLKEKFERIEKEHPDDLLNYKNEVVKLKAALNQTLEANYNLSVKFLRMKNTKFYLKSRLNSLQMEHNQAMHDLQNKITTMKNEISQVVDKQFKLPISPSHKKYLQIIKQNGALIHENLSLQLEVDRLNYDLNKIKMSQKQNETKSKLKFINSKSKETLKTESSVQSTKSITWEEPLQPNKNKAKKNLEKGDEIVTKIFEKNKTEGVPQIVMVPQILKTRETREIVDTLEMSDSKLTLLQVSENPSLMCTETEIYGSRSSQICEAIRTQSAPEIVQTSFFQ